MLISGFISSSIIAFLLTLDGLIYDLVRYIYEIFLFLAKLNLFDESDYMEIVGKIYIILGVVMLFILAYSLLRAIINPDDFAKGDYSFPNIIKNVIISIIIIAVLPTVFTVAFNIQAAVLNSDVIPKIILNDNGLGSDTVDQGGNTIAYNVFAAFFQPNEDYCNDLMDKYPITEDECQTEIETNTHWYTFGLEHTDTLRDVETHVLNHGSFTAFSKFSDAADDGQIRYTFIISTIVGILVGAILLSYCIDLGVRVIKLLFFQIVAPVPVICRVLPGEKKKIFDNWMKQTISTFLEVFIRIAILYLGVYLITKVVNKFSPSNINSLPGIGTLGTVQRLFALVFLIVGILLFVRSAPKLIKDIFGIELGGGTLSRLLGMGAAVGGGVLGFTHNFAKGIRGNKGLLRSAASAFAGGASSAARSAYNAKNAKNLSDMKNATLSGVKASDTARSDRITYKAKHGGTFMGAIGGHLSDAADFITGNGVEELEARIKAANEIDAANTKFRDALKKQWDKHSTDSSLLIDMSVDANGKKGNQFKGEGSDQMLVYYNEYRKRKLSASAIKQDIEAQRSAHQKRDYEVLARERLGEFGDEQINAIDMDQFAIKDANGTITGYDDAKYQEKIKALREDHEKKILEEAAKLRSAEATKISILDSMYSQMEKYNITQLGEKAMSGQGLGSIEAKDLFEARLLGKTAEDTIKSSQLVFQEGGKTYINDPRDNSKKVFDPGKRATSFDDFATAANNNATADNLKKQAYLDKKGKSN